MSLALRDVFADTAFWIALVVKQDRGLTEALTTDEHFQQAGFQAMLLREP